MKNLCNNCKFNDIREDENYCRIDFIWRSLDTNNNVIECSDYQLKNIIRNIINFIKYESN